MAFSRNMNWIFLGYYFYIKYATFSLFDYLIDITCMLLQTLQRTTYFILVQREEYDDLCGYRSEIKIKNRHTSYILFYMSYKSKKLN